MAAIKPATESCNWWKGKGCIQVDVTDDIKKDIERFVPGYFPFVETKNFKIDLYTLPFYRDYRLVRFEDEVMTSEQPHTAQARVAFALYAECEELVLLDWTIKPISHVNRFDNSLEGACLTSDTVLDYVRFLLYFAFDLVIFEDPDELDRLIGDPREKEVMKNIVNPPTLVVHDERSISPTDQSGTECDLSALPARYELNATAIADRIKLVYFRIVVARNGDVVVLRPESGYQNVRLAEFAERTTPRKDFIVQSLRPVPWAREWETVLPNEKHRTGAGKHDGAGPDYGDIEASKRLSMLVNDEQFKKNHPIIRAKIIRRTPLSFYGSDGYKGRLYELLLLTAEGWLRVFALSAGMSKEGPHFVPLEKTRWESRPIHDANKYYSVPDAESRRLYLEFFCWTISGEEGRFLIVNRCRDIPWSEVPALRQLCEIKESIQRRIRSASAADAGMKNNSQRSLAGLLDNHATTRANNSSTEKHVALVQYGEALFEAVFSLDDKGNVQMDDDNLIADKLKLLPEHNPKNDVSLL